MLLIMALLMTVVLVFLITGVQDFYTNQFETQMRTVFFNTEFVGALRIAAGEQYAVMRMHALLVALQGDLGIDRVTRNFYVLDGTTGAVLATSNPDGRRQVNITSNISAALLGTSAFGGGSPRADYMDVAVVIASHDGASTFVIYIVDNKQTVQSLNADILMIILRAVLIGFAIAVIISLIISKALITPVQGMTKAAESMAGGDFSTKIKVESADEIGILAKTFNDMALQIETSLEELKKAEKLRREFVANVSHELRTPLTNIRSYAETISEDKDIPADTEEEFLRVIINESDRMTKIVQDLLELSRLDSGASVLSVEEFSIEEAVRDVYAAIALDARKRGHVLNLELEWKLPMIKGDRAKIEQVLMNIIANALKYTPDGGTIAIFSGTTGNDVWVKIEDTGVGIPADDLQRVFDRFYRVDKARTRESGGTGLGLSIAKEIIMKHGGDITIESAPGVGTTVTVKLPIEGGVMAS